MDRIGIRNLHFYAYHGALAEERHLGQSFYVDLDLYLPLEEAGRSDELEQTVHYGEVCAAVEAVMREPKDLIEAVAEQIAAHVLATFERIEGIGVVVRKPQAPIPMSFDHVEVAIERWRHA